MSFYLNGQSVYLSHYASDGELCMSTALKVDREKYKANKLPKDQQAVLNRISAAIDQYESTQRLTGGRITKASIRQIVLYTTKRSPDLEPIGETFKQYFGKYLVGIERGEILNEGKRYSDSLMNLADTIQRHHIKGSCLENLPVARITEENIKAFGAELTAKGMARNSVATFMAIVIGFISAGRRAKLHDGQKLDTRGARVTWESIDHGVYLTPDEQRILLALELKAASSRMRDALIFGCQVGLRHSDLIRLTKKNLVGANLNINTKKTGADVWVPLNSTAREIWDRCDGRPLKNVGHADFMRHIKALGKLAGIDKPVLFTRTEGGQKIEKWVKKWELLGTHTMRRSFATNAYKAGLPVPSIMKITGHKTTTSFLKYIRLSNEEHAELMSKHEFFK